jgi:hypothetical protein
MTNKSESLQASLGQEKPKVLTGFDQKVSSQELRVSVSGLADVELPAYKWGLIFHIESVRNVVNPYSSRKGNLFARKDDKNAGKGTMKKAKALL